MNEKEITKARALIRNEEGNPGGYGYVLFEGIISKIYNENDEIFLFVIAYENGNVFWVDSADWVPCSTYSIRIQEEHYESAKLEELDWVLWNLTGFEISPRSIVKEFKHDCD